MWKPEGLLGNICSSYCCSRTDLPKTLIVWINHFIMLTDSVVWNSERAYQRWLFFLLHNIWKDGTAGSNAMTEFWNYLQVSLLICLAPELGWHKSLAQLRNWLSMWTWPVPVEWVSSQHVGLRLFILLKVWLRVPKVSIPVWGRSCNSLYSLDSEVRVTSVALFWLKQTQALSDSRECKVDLTS